MTPKSFGNRSGVLAGIVTLVVLALPGIAHPQTESVLHTFEASSDGAGPWGGLIVDSAGNLYGAATWGGVAGNAGPCDNGNASGCGSIFELSPPAAGTSGPRTFFIASLASRTASVRKDR